MGVGGQRHDPAAFIPGKDTAPMVVEEAGWAPGPVWIGAENLAPTGIRSPDLPARSESLYRLSYSGPYLEWVVVGYFIWGILSGLLFNFSHGKSKEFQKYGSVKEQRTQ
jgi:hypothetical protein